MEYAKLPLKTLEKDIHCTYSNGGSSSVWKAVKLDWHKWIIKNVHGYQEN